MLNQIRRIWSDTGKDDKDFSAEDLKLKQALLELKSATETVSKAAATLLDLLHSRA
jgi:hypothetical protein